MIFELVCAVTVILPQDASRSQQTAAEELRDYCGRMGVASGTIEIRTDESLGENGYRFEGMEDGVVISGSRARGALNGAYGYLQDKCGVEWFSSYCEVVPKRSSLPRIEAPETHRPAFEVRCSFWEDIMKSPKLAARLRLNSNVWYARDDRYGPDLHRIDSLFGFAHSFRFILPPEKYFKDHPEWFSEIDGRRISKNPQPCMTNEGLFEFVKGKLIEQIKKDPGVELYGLCLYDYYNDCTCQKCREVNEREGTAGGTYWHFANRLADVLKEHAPGAGLKCSIYQQTSEPPKTIRLRDNIFLDWAPIDAVRDEPIAISRHPRSTACMRQLEGYRRIFDGRYIVWDYTTCFNEYVLPFPNLPTLQPNLKFFRDLGVYYMFEEGNHNGWHGEFSELKGWLLAQWMWNPDLDEKALYRRFINGFYGEAAAPHVYEYITLLNDTIRRSPKNQPVTISDGPARRPEYFERGFLDRAASLWDAAEAAVKNDAQRSYNVRMSALPVRYIQCLKYAKTVNLTDDPKALEKGRGYAKRFVALLDEAAAAKRPVSFGETNHDAMLRRIRDFASGAATTGDGRRARFGAKVFVKCCADDVCRKEKNASGYDGCLLYLHNNDYGWHPTFSLDTVAFEPGAEYVLRMRVKVKTTGVEGDLFSAGVYDVTAQKGYSANVSTKNLKNGGDWAWYDVAAWKPGMSHQSYLYAAAGWFDKKKHELSPAHSGVWIDGFEIVRRP